MKPEDFLLRDYELKVRYLTDHFQRMWTRFNFFVTMETALVGRKVIFGSGQLSRDVATVGGVLSVVWYVFGAEDRFLVRVYRKSVQEAATNLLELFSQAEETSIKPYLYVGEIDEIAKDLVAEDRKKPLVQRCIERLAGWRRQSISTTRLAALFPLLVLLFWVIVFIIQPRVSTH